MKKILLILLILASLTSFSVEITGPKHKVEGGVGIFDIYRRPKTTLNVSYNAQWKAEINKKFDVTFGPKISVTGDVWKFRNGNENITHGGVTTYVGFESDFNVKIDDTENKFYIGLETGAGVGIYHQPLNHHYHYNPIVAANFIGKVTIGGKINDKYNIGFYTGYGKGLVGFETGYTF